MEQEQSSRLMDAASGRLWSVSTARRAVHAWTAWCVAWGARGARRGAGRERRWAGGVAGGWTPRWPAATAATRSSPPPTAPTASWKHAPAVAGYDIFGQLLLAFEEAGAAGGATWPSVAGSTASSSPAAAVRWRAVWGGRHGLRRWRAVAAQRQGRARQALRLRESAAAAAEQGGVVARRHARALLTRWRDVSALTLHLRQLGSLTAEAARLAQLSRSVSRIELYARTAPTSSAAQAATRARVATLRAFFRWLAAMGPRGATAGT